MQIGNIVKRIDITNHDQNGQDILGVVILIYDVNIVDVKWPDHKSNTWHYLDDLQVVYDNAHQAIYDLKALVKVRDETIAVYADALNKTKQKKENTFWRDAVIKGEEYD